MITININRNTPIGAAIATLKKEAADRQSAAAILEALIATVTGEPTSPAEEGPRHRRRGKRGAGCGQAAIEIIRAAGRPLHGLTEILPALEARGYRIERSGLPTTLMRTKRIRRTAPGTFGLKDALYASNDVAAPESQKAGA
jgi:hypothetical protein